MTDIATANSTLSPTFGRARSVSRWLRMAFTVLFWLALAYLAAAAVVAIAPVDGKLLWEDIMIPFPRDDLGKRLLNGLWLWTGVLPSLLLLHQARRLFGCFAAGEVFGAAPVAHIRAAGFWLLVSAITAFAAKIGLHAANDIHGNVELNVQSLLFGAATFVAAHVMGEARRIADENASIL